MGIGNDDANFDAGFFLDRVFQLVSACIWIFGQEERHLSLLMIDVRLVDTRMRANQAEIVAYDQNTFALAQNFG